MTTGATSDLRQATRLARHMVVDCGMSEQIGPGAFGWLLWVACCCVDGVAALWCSRCCHECHAVVRCCRGSFAPPCSVSSYGGTLDRPRPSPPRRLPAVHVGSEHSHATRQAVDVEIQKILKESYARVSRWASARVTWPAPARNRHPCAVQPSALLPAVCCSLLKEREAELRTLAQALLREETLTQAQIKSLLAGSSRSPELPGSSGPGGIPQVDLAGAAAAAAAGPALGGDAEVRVPAAAAASLAGAAGAPDAPPAAE